MLNLSWSKAFPMSRSSPESVIRHSPKHMKRLDSPLGISLAQSSPGHLTRTELLSSFAPMSLFNSVLGSLSPKFRNSFEDPYARDHELPLYNSPPMSPRIPPPIASTVLRSAPPSISPPPRVPDDLLALQRKARHLEQQLQELLDAQADGLMSGLAGNDNSQDESFSNGSTTPTVSSIRGNDRSAENGEYGPHPRKRKIGLNAARRGIFRRIQQLAAVKAEEMDMLDQDLRDLQAIWEKTDIWTHKRSRLEKRISDIGGEGTGARAKALQEDASKLEQEIRQKEEELWALKARHRRMLDELADSENSMEAKLSSYKASLSILDKEIASFLARPPDTDHISLSPSPFLSLPPKRRTLEMAHDYWKDEHSRLAEKCQEVDIDRAALDEGAVLWNNVVKRVVDFEAKLQNHMQQAGRNSGADPSNLLSQMETAISFLEEKMDLATSRNWNLLVCAIGAELEAFKQGQEILQEVLGLSMKVKGKAKVSNDLIDTESSNTESEDEGSLSAIRIGRSPKPSIPLKPKFFDTDDEDPDPELMISHQDTDTD
ncbi:uncharacterized protein BDR25DRAFT_390986 [Lindgomyces ingoldianus]|uniref:Uncharacterized protein n=1 Tax=Lindgomyces ingoldianus TaxID=673940 RepID=A0ACB6RCI9_9PLEO|nr:uncharacterized protein BDR25DRAFT_390986 [Lindgomyces ingoldianus]KAF2476468.1 hypothetical protein BDR25DRAFT_390986 [Lindgomyces ingoldianus]